MATYRLQALLDIRDREKKAAEERLAEAQRALAEEETRLKDEEATLERMIEDRRRRRASYAEQLASGEMKVTDQSNAYRFIDRLKEREIEQQTAIDAQREQVREAEKEVQRTREALMVATQNLKALEKHREKWADEVKRARMLRDEGVLDELGQAIFQRRRKDDRS